MKTECETKTPEQLEALLGRPIYENPAQIYPLTNETGRYLVELAKLNVEYTLLSVRVALGLVNK